jgi:hypothetical protein
VKPRMSRSSSDDNNTSTVELITVEDGTRTRLRR